MKKDLWTFKIIILAFIISFVFSFMSELIMPKVNILISILILILFIFVGILFDMVGVAITTCDIKPFHSMNAKKIHYAKTGIRLITNSARVSSFCNDVIGDICGIVSGTAGVIIVSAISNSMKVNVFFTSLITTALIASVTIGGKAIGKNIAIKNSTKIVVIFSKAICKFYK